MTKSDKKEQEKVSLEEENKNKKSENKEETIEEKLKTTQEKLLRSMAEMENQRRRFEKEKEDAFDYGGFTFAREALNLLDNLERSKKNSRK